MRRRIWKSRLDFNLALLCDVLGDIQVLLVGQPERPRVEVVAKRLLTLLFALTSYLA